MQIMFKTKTRLGNKFYSKDRSSKDLITGDVYKFQCGFRNDSYYGEYARHFNVKIGENTGISSFFKKHIKPKNSFVANQ